MASHATVSRYRPALAVLAALAAGYTIYYVHSTHQASKLTREAQPLRRRQVNNRRRPHRQRQNEEPRPEDDYPETTWDAHRLMQEWQLAPTQFEEVYLLDRKYWADDSTPRMIPLRRRPPALSLLISDYGVSDEDAAAVREDYEQTLFRTFICKVVPPKCILKDEDGGSVAFSRAIAAEPEDLMFPNNLMIVVDLFNFGSFDHLGVRRDTYRRYNVVPKTRKNVDLEKFNFEGLDALMDELAEHDDDSDSDDSETVEQNQDAMEIVSQSESSWHDGETKNGEGQSLLNMLYHIAEDQARREGYVHRGVTCNSCNNGPIHGLRYRCINCVDFDLCETCEAMQIHPKTHLFLKIRIPTPSYASSRKPQPLWYPGRTTGLSSNLPRGENKALTESTGFTENEVEALWDQFKNLAATEWSGDPAGFHWAIDRHTFHKCFSLWAGPTPRGPPASLVYDRLFSFYDSNHDGLIGFEEFVQGMAAAKSKNPSTKLKRTFEGFDFDGDGYIRRADVLAIFKSCYALQKDLARDFVADYGIDLLEGGSLRETITSNQPISSGFTGSYDGSGHARFNGHGKVRDPSGDLIIGDDRGILLSNGSDEEDLDQIIGDLKEIAVFDNVVGSFEEDSSRATFVRSSVEETRSWSKPCQHELDEITLSKDWPPAIVSPRDVDGALGKTTAIGDIVSEDERKRVLYHAQRRCKWLEEAPKRKTTRNEALKDRSARAHFYVDDGPNGADGNTAQSQFSDMAHIPNSAAEVQASPPSTFDETQGAFRIPPVMPDNIGQEILFQVTRECINELIDPLFKLREDLSLLYQEHAQDFALFKPHLDIYLNRMNTELASLQLIRFLKAQDADGAYEPVALPSLLQEFVTSLDNRESDNYKAYLQDKAVIEQVFPANKSHPTSPRSLPALEDQALVLTNSDLQETPSLGSGASQQEESEVEYPQAAMELHEGVRVFNENDVGIEEEIAKKVLDDLLESSGYSIVPEPSSESMVQSINTSRDSSSEPEFDPTLPQFRPSAGIETSEPTAKPSTEQEWHAAFRAAALAKQNSKQQTSGITIPEPHPPSWGKEFNSFIRYLAVLMRAKRHDEGRGGPGRINFREYSAIVNSASGGPDLEFLGQWIDMQAM